MLLISHFIKWRLRRHYKGSFIHPTCYRIIKTQNFFLLIDFLTVDKGSIPVSHTVKSKFFLVFCHWRSPRCLQDWIPKWYSYLCSVWKVDEFFPFCLEIFLFLFLFFHFLDIFFVHFFQFFLFFFFESTLAIAHVSSHCL